MLDFDFHERLVRLETQMSGMSETVNTTAKEVREIHDHILTTKGRHSGAWRVLSILGAIIAGVATGVGALAAIFPHN